MWSKKLLLTLASITFFAGWLVLPITPPEAASTDQVTFTTDGFTGTALMYCKNLSTGSPQLSASVKPQTDHRGTLYLFKWSKTGLPAPLPGHDIECIINAVIDSIGVPRLNWWPQGLNIESIEVRDLATVKERLVIAENAPTTFDSGSLKLTPGIKARITIKGKVKNPTPVTCPCFNQARIKYLQGLVLENFRAGDPVSEICVPKSYLFSSSPGVRIMVLRAPRLNGTLSCELGFGLGNSSIFDSRDDLTADELTACQDLLPPACLGF